MKTISGEVKSDCTVCGVGEGVDATVWRISPIWHVTAVQGREPIKEPNMQSFIATPQTPHATLMPDHGTMPISLRIDSRTQAEDFDFAIEESAPEPPSMTLRVISSARGKTRTKNGANGAHRRLAKIEPTVVSIVNSMVAYNGENKAPASTFCEYRH